MENNVRSVRRIRKMRIEDLAAASGVPVRTISDIEHGAEPRVSTAIYLARALSTNVESLLIV